jgi:hypothetical protein
MERKLLGIIWWQEAVTEGNKAAGEGVDIGELEKKFNGIIGDKREELVKSLEAEKDLLIFETESYYGNRASLKQDMDELLIGLEEEYLKAEFSEAMAGLQKAEQGKDSGQVLKWLEECQRISQRINMIKTIRNAYEQK